jgi:hypothetical protein
MSLLVGVSSSSLPHGSAQDLLRCAAVVDADCIDLRADRGQRWEPELDLIAEALPVTFVGIGARLGAGVAEAPAPPELMHSIIKRGIALRLFVERLDDTAGVRRFAEDVARLRGTWGPNLRLAVEPHTAVPSLAQLDAVLAEHHVGAVVDTLGLVRQSVRLHEARAFLLRHAIAVQVKGLGLRNGDYHHVALDASPSLTRWTAALLLGAQVPVTVETKAGTVAEDIHTIRRVTAGRHETVPDRIPEEISSCFPAY